MDDQHPLQDEIIQLIEKVPRGGGLYNDRLHWFITYNGILAIWPIADSQRRPERPTLKGD